MADTYDRTVETRQTNLYDAFARDGYVILHGVLPIEEVDDCASELSRLRQIRSDLIVLSTAPARDRIDSMIKLAEAGNEIDAVEQIALNRTIVDVLREILGQEPVARYTRLLAQSPGALLSNAERRGTPHLHNFGMATRPSGGRVIVWTPIDDVHPDAGPMWFLPGSHIELASFPDRLLDAVPNSRLQLHQMWNEGATAEDWLEWHGNLGEHSMEILADWMEQIRAQPVPVMLRRGDVLIFSNDLLHGTLVATNPNLPRRIMFTHYHADGRELWEIGDAIGSDENPNGPRFFEKQDWVRRQRGLTDPGGFRRFYASMKGFLDRTLDA